MAKHPIRSNWAFLAQSVERSPFKRVAAGSSPAEGNSGPLAQFGRAAR